MIYTSYITTFVKYIFLKNLSYVNRFLSSFLYPKVLKIMDGPCNIQSFDVKQFKKSPENKAKHSLKRFWADSPPAMYDHMRILIFHDFPYLPAALVVLLRGVMEGRGGFSVAQCG